MNEVELRTPTVNDVDEMWRVRTAAILAVSDAYYPLATRQHWANIEMPNDFANAFEVLDAIVCTHQSTLVGWGFVNLHFSRVDALFVDPYWQRNGFGSLIARKFEEIARQRNLEKLDLSSTLNAVPFYQRLGFESQGDFTYNHPNGFTLPSVRMVKYLRKSQESQPTERSV